MGWSGGSDIARGLIKTILRNVPDAKVRLKIYKDMIDVLEDNDWDTQDEALGIDVVFDDYINRED